MADLGVVLTESRPELVQRLRQGQVDPGSARQATAEVADLDEVLGDSRRELVLRVG